MSVEMRYNERVSKIKEGFIVMINICPNCKGIIGNETVCPKCGVNILDYKEEIETKSVETHDGIDSKSAHLNNGCVDATQQTLQNQFVGVTALVRCPACGRERVSDCALACPECGFTIKAYYDKVKIEEKRKAQITAQIEAQKRIQEENVKRKIVRKKKLFGSPVKKIAWISAGCVALGLFVVLGFHIHRENEVSDAIRSSQRWFDDMQEDVSKLQNKLENAYFVIDDEPTILEKEQMEAIEELVRSINIDKRMVDYNCEIDERVIISLDGHIKWKTSYQTWEEYKKFLTNNFLISDSSEKSAEQLIKSRTYNSYEEIREEKRSKSLFIDSVYLSSNSSYDIVSGSVTNNTSLTVKFVVVQISLKDENGKTFDSDTTYVCGEEGIRPGASAKFECYFDKDKRTDNCYVSILRYN